MPILGCVIYGVCSGVYGLSSGVYGNGGFFQALQARLLLAIAVCNIKL